MVRTEALGLKGSGGCLVCRTKQVAGVGAHVRKVGVTSSWKAALPT